MKLYRLIVALFLASALSTVANAQNRILVTGFELASGPGSLDANIQGGIRYDINGRQCALIKIETTQTGFTFDFGAAARAEDSEEKVAEIWVWVSPGVKFVTLSHPRLGKSDRYTFPIPIESAKTYIMKLTTAEVQTTIKEAVTQQFLVFEIEPADANAALFVNEEFWPIEDGIASKYVEFGEYSWRVEAPDYYTEAGMAVVSDAAEKAEVKVKLSPAFGYLDIPATADLQDATVYIDNISVGKIPLGETRVKSGTHSLRIMKRYYDNYESRITVEDGKTLTITPEFVSNAAMTTLIVENDAEIVANGSVLGTGTWRGVLEPGRYRFETRKEFHRSRDLTRDIVRNANDTIHLPAPTPIVGSIMINTKPAKVQVSLDGKPVGETPLRLADVFAGDHLLTLSVEGYETIADSIKVVENQTLRKTYEFTPKTAGGKDMTFVPVKVKKELIKRNCFYMEGRGAFGAGLMQAVGGAAGAYFANINIEASYLMGLAKTADVYWYDQNASEYAPSQVTSYTPSVIGGRVGYQIRLSRGVSLTPQAGINHTMLASSVSGANGDGAYCTTAAVGVRAFFAFSSFLGLSIAPEFAFSVMESDGFGKISKSVPGLDAFKGGLNVKGGIVLFF